MSLTPVLDWEDHPQAVTYTLQVDDDAAFASPLIDDSTLTASSYAVAAPLAAGATYYWRVTAVTANGSWSAINNGFAFTTLPTPGAFNLVLPADTAHGVSQTPFLDWEDSSDAAAYRLQLDDDFAFGSPAIDDATLTESSYTVSTPLASEVKYYWRVTAVNASGSTAASNNDFSFLDEPFTDIDAGLPGLDSCSVAWGDYDNDGDLDLAVAGGTTNPLLRNPLSRIYRNDGGTFTDIEAGLIGVAECALAWGDYDNDGDLDLALAGSWYDTQYHLESRLYRNDGGVFVDANAGLRGVPSCSLAWGDYDNDGDLDLVLAGSNTSLVYRNDNCAFVNVAAGLDALEYSSVYRVAWGDCDNDSDLDLLFVGGPTSRLYRNDDGTFTDANADLQGAYGGALAWGDYDNDGDLDVALCGYRDFYKAIVYRNDGGGTFTDIGAGLIGVQFGGLAWGDYDNDGDLDLALTGRTSSGYTSRIYRNDAGAFTDANAGLPLAMDSALAWGDYDNDGDLDLVLAGYSSGARTCRIFRNNGSANAAPLAPTGLGAVVSGCDATLSWATATDAQTPPAGLSYNLRIGTAAGLDDVFSGAADTGSGLRRLPATGNAQKSLAWTIGGLPGDTYYWSVQAVDPCLAGSAWAAGDAFTVAGPSVALKTPNGGERLVAETTYAITWAAAGVTAVKLELSRNGGADWEEIEAPIVASDGAYDWTVSAPASFDCLVRVSDASDPATNDVSDRAFTVQPFTEVPVGLPGLGFCSIAWGDYDADGDLDLAAAGEDADGNGVSAIYRNDGGAFVDIVAGLTGVYYCSLAWGDCDNDGDLDLALAGYDGSVAVSKIYRNDGGAFTDIDAGLTGVSRCSVAWGDYDNDGDLDLKLKGRVGVVPLLARVYRNDAGTFVDSGNTFPGGYSSSVAWGDYDNDGDLDLVTAGDTNPNHCVLYNNDAGSFTSVDPGLIGVGDCSVAWGDYDNDGDLDLAVAGDESSYEPVSKIYRNDGGGTFTEIDARLTSVERCSVAWGDYDNDGDLDLALAGYDGSRRVTKLYRNDSGVIDAPPDAPTGLSAAASSLDVTFSWSPVTDAETPSPGLSYNLRVGTGSGLDDVFSGTADAVSGLRRVPATGNVQKVTSWTLRSLSEGTYHWSVQAVDTGFAGSPWAAEDTVDVVGPGVIVKSPNGDEVLAVGSVYEITWAAAGMTNVKIELSRNGGADWEDIVGSTLAAPGSYAWTVTNPSSRNCLVRISDASLPAVSDTSDEEFVIPPFTETAAVLPGFSSCTLAWGDYDNDGDLDIALVGMDENTFTHAQVFRNDGGLFTDIDAGLAGFMSAAIAWGDYDNDGDLDLVLAGGYVASPPRTKLYRNDGGAFVEIDAGLPGVATCSLAWGDYDNDGDLDLALAGNSSTGAISRIYRNDDGAFIDIDAGLAGVYVCSVAWGDYDNDGDLDLALAGNSSTGTISRIYRNDGGAFVDIDAGLTGVYDCSLAWGDYDNDGDLDLAVGSRTPAGTVYRNDGGTFTDIDAGLPEVESCSLAWGDYDNDGDLDILLTGYEGAFIYRNDGGTFIDISAELAGTFMAWGDCDNDGDLDLAWASGIHQNDIGVANVAPDAPTGLGASHTGTGPYDVTFTWSSPATADETPEAGLSYNLRVGTSPGGDEVFSGQADAASGKRRIPARGAAQPGASFNEWTLVLPAGTYHWSVQAVDTALEGGAWAVEETVSIP